MGVSRAPAHVETHVARVPPTWTGWSVSVKLQLKGKRGKTLMCHGRGQYQCRL